MTNKKYLNRWDRSLQNNYGKPSITLVKGKGVLVTDADGKSYMDFLGGIAGALVFRRIFPRLAQMVGMNQNGEAAKTRAGD